MKYHITLFLLCLASLHVSRSLSADSESGQLIVTSDFSKAGVSGLPQVVDEKDRETIPFEHPTHAHVSAPSTMELRPGGEGSYKEPIIVLGIGKAPESDTDTAAYAKLTWDLKKAKLPSKGIYELTYTLIPLKLPVFGGRMQFHLVDPAGVPLSDTVVHITTMPSVSFRGDTLGSTHEQIKVKEGKAYEIKFLLDLEKHRWSAWLDGKNLAKKEALPEFLTNAYPEVGLGGFSFGSEGGLADKAGGSFAIGAVKLVRVKESSN